MRNITFLRIFRHILLDYVKKLLFNLIACAEGVLASNSPTHFLEYSAYEVRLAGNCFFLIYNMLTFRDKTSFISASFLVHPPWAQMRYSWRFFQRPNTFAKFFFSQCAQCSLTPLKRIFSPFKIMLLNYNPTQSL
jgi:hypothetical protein